jgi:hypothetical protein
VIKLSILIHGKSKKDIEEFEKCFQELVSQEK